MESNKCDRESQGFLTATSRRPSHRLPDDAGCRKSPHGYFYQTRIGKLRKAGDFLYSPRGCVLERMMTTDLAVRTKRTGTLGSSRANEFSYSITGLSFLSFFCFCFLGLPTPEQEREPVIKTPLGTVSKHEHTPLVFKPYTLSLKPPTASDRRKNGTFLRVSTCWHRAIGCISSKNVT